MFALCVRTIKTFSATECRYVLPMCNTHLYAEKKTLPFCTTKSWGDQGFIAVTDYVGSTPASVEHVVPVCNIHVLLCIFTLQKYNKTSTLCCSTAVCPSPHVLPVCVCLPLSVIESRVALRWQLARLIPVREGRGPAPGVTQTCQA